MFGITQENLTSGEKLFIDRKRRNENQKQAAKRYKVSVLLYGRWERDQVRVLVPCDLPELQPHEYCVLYRRRLNIGQQKLIEELNVCRYWLGEMERGKVPVKRLLNYWDDKYAATTAE